MRGSSPRMTKWCDVVAPLLCRDDARLPLLDDERVVGAGRLVAGVLGLVHDPGGNVVGLPGADRLPFASRLLRDDRAFHHGSVLVAGMNVAAGGAARSKFR